MKKQPYHLVERSSWPILASMAALLFIVGSGVYMYQYTSEELRLLILFVGFGLVVFVIFFISILMVVCWKNENRESTYQKEHTKLVALGIHCGMILFIVAGIMFFVAFFWALSHSSVAPTVDIEVIWNFILCQLINLFGPAALSWALHFIPAKYRPESILPYFITIVVSGVRLAILGENIKLQVLPVEWEPLIRPHRQNVIERPFWIETTPIAGSDRIELKLLTEPDLENEDRVKVKMTYIERLWCIQHNQLVDLQGRIVGLSQQFLGIHNVREVFYSSGAGQSENIDSSGAGQSENIDSSGAGQSEDIDSSGAGQS